MKGDFSDKLTLSDSSLFNSVINMSCFYRVERAFHKLVEDMMYFDLSLRTEVENAELLIFPSILLPIQCRSESHLYLYYFFQWHISNLLFVKQNCVLDYFCRISRKVLLVGCLQSKETITVKMVWYVVESLLVLKRPETL